MLADICPKSSRLGLYYIIFVFRETLEIPEKMEKRDKKVKVEREEKVEVKVNQEITA